MNITENEFLKKQILKLAENKSTGCPKELAGLLGISERNLFRLIESIKDEDFNIRYSRVLRTYIIEYI
ncbi:hypothetical protein [Marinifilum sp.]|uniref:hypothetical protein n=1 Tax=Marinifilum sp. TaxID=2033137 RepID=UPI003BA8CBC1